MRPSAFDTLVRSCVRSGTRRRLLAGLSLLGALAVVGEDAAAAQPPLDRVQQRTQQRNRKQRNNHQSNNKNNKTNKNRNKGKSQAPVCTVGQICGQPSTCTNGCFCVQSVEGANFCIQLADNNCQPKCTSSTECAGGFCATAQCCSSGGQGQDGFTACIPAANVCTS